MKKLNKKQIAAGALAGLATGAALVGGIGAIADDSDKVIADLNETVAELQANLTAVKSQEPVVITETVEVEKVVEKNITVEVPVDNGNLDLVLEEIYDNDGKVQYLTEDLDDDEVDQIVERVVFANEVKALAVAEAKSEIADLINKEVVDGVELDEDDVEKVRIDDEDDEVIIDDIDFEDKDADVIVTGRVEVDDAWYNFETIVEIKDNEVEDIDLVSLELDE